jgi:hypothetical protein
MLLLLYRKRIKKTCSSDYFAPLVTAPLRFTVPLYAPIGTPEPGGLEAGPFLAPIGTADPAGLLRVAFLAPFGTPDPAALLAAALLAPIGTPDPALVAGPVGGRCGDVGSLLTEPVF